jgi:phage gpG-like protein
MNFQQFTDKTLKDIEVKATELFDRNFEQQGFFGTKWAARKNGSNGRAILMGVGRLRRGVKTPKRSGNTIVWNIDVPYAKIHNEGGTIKATQSVRPFSRTIKGREQKVRAFTRSVNIKMPQRQFIGDHPQLNQAVEVIVSRNAKKLIEDFKTNFKK